MKIYSQHYIQVFTILAWTSKANCKIYNITIGFLRNGTQSYSFVDNFVNSVNSISEPDIRFHLKYFDVNQLNGDSFQILGNDVTSDLAIMVAREAPYKISQSITNILNIPLITTGGLSCYSKLSKYNLSCNNAFSVATNHNQLSRFISQILKEFNITNVGVIFQTKRIADLNSFLNTFGVSNIQILLSVETDSNGMLVNVSTKRLQTLLSASLVILIYDECDLPKLFEFLKSSYLSLCSERIKMVYYGLMSKEYKDVCEMYTVVGVQVQKVLNSDLAMYGSDVNTIIQTTQHSEDLLLIDAFYVVINITTQLVRKNLWVQMASNAAHMYEATRKNTANFTAILKQAKLNGITGTIQFNVDGSRKNLTLSTVNVQENKLKKIGRFIDDTIQFDEIPRENIPYTSNDTFINGHITVVTIVDEPFTFQPINESDSSNYTGFCIDILNELAKNLNFTYSIYLVKDKEYGGKKANGEWTGMIGDVLSNKADLAVAPLTISHGREEVVEFTKPYMEVQNSYVRQRKNDVEFDLFQYLKPFTTNVWIIIVFAGLLSSIVLYGVDYLSPYGWRQTIKERTGRDGDVFSVSNSIWFTVASWLLQGGDNTPRTLSGRIFVGAFWFVILIVTSTYTANMAAYFTFSKSIKESEDIESLLKEGVSFSLKEKTALDQFLQVSDYKVYKLLSEKIKEQDKYVKNATEGIKAAQADPNLLFIGEGLYSEWLINRFACNLKIVHGIFPSRSYGFPVRKGSHFSEKISIGISHLEESRFIQQRKDYYWKELSKCKQNLNAAGITDEGRVEPLQLVGVYGCLVIGIIVSVILLILEIWWKRSLQEKKQKVTMMIRRATTVRRAFQEKENDPKYLPNAMFRDNKQFDIKGPETSAVEK